MKIMLPLSALALLVLTGCRSTSSLPAVTDFDLQRYSGTWYEAARYPHRFEKGMSSVSAAYALNDDGTVKVLNKGFLDEKNQWKSIEGVAKMKNRADVGWLKVSFFKPFYASYKIIYLNEEYSEAIVTGPSFKYLWILVRDPNLTPEQLEALIAKAETFGFDRNKLILVDQSKR